MKKQTKLVAVLSTAALLAIGASMTSFAATGWAEEDGTWVYYNRDGERATDSWKKSGNNWYYLDSDGEMAIDQLIEDGDNYYYVDINGVMASNQWVAIENEDAGEDDEPEHYWYYFQANGKALTNGDNAKVALKTINGKKYAFDEEGKMLYGWVAEDNAERIDNTDGDAFKEGDYYFGGEDDGAMTTGWLQMDITYEEATTDNFVAPVFNEDEDQTRWFYFQSNGKKVKADETKNDTQKGKTINGKKYEFDQKGVMTAEWSLDVDKITSSAANDPATRGNAAENSTYAKYAHQWRYFNSVEDGARVSKGWFKVVPAEYLNEDKYNDDEDFWYYADGSGNLYAGEFKTIKGKKYAFRDDGRMLNGLKFIKEDEANQSLSVYADDHDTYNFDNEDDFLDHAAEFYEPNGYKCFYFGDEDDGAMRTNKTNVEIDGENHNFYFEKSGGHKGAGVTGEEDDKLYQSGMLLKADSDDKYVLVHATGNINETGVKVFDYDNADIKNIDGVESFNIKSDKEDEDNLKGYYGFGTADEGWYLVNTSGRIQTGTKSGTKDGYDMYWFMYKDNIKFYADDKNISDYDELKGNGWHTYFDNAK